MFRECPLWKRSLWLQRPCGGVCYLDAPEASKLLDRGEVGSAQVLPQPVRVADVVVQVVGDVAETWRRTATGSSRNPTCPPPNTHSKGFWETYPFVLPALSVTR